MIFMHFLTNNFKKQLHSGNLIKRMLANLISILYVRNFSKLSLIQTVVLINILLRVLGCNFTIPKLCNISPHMYIQARAVTIFFATCGTNIFLHAGVYSHMTVQTLFCQLLSTFWTKYIFLFHDVCINTLHTLALTQASHAP